MVDTNRILLFPWNLVRSIAMLRSIWNASMKTYIIERLFDFVIGPIIYLLYGVQYEHHPRMMAFRKWYSSFFGRNIFRAGFINVIYHSEEDEKTLEQETPFVF